MAATKEEELEARHAREVERRIQACLECCYLCVARTYTRPFACILYPPLILFVQVAATKKEELEAHHAREVERRMHPKRV